MRRTCVGFIERLLLLASSSALGVVVTFEDPALDDAVRETLDTLIGQQVTRWGQ